MKKGKWYIGRSLYRLPYRLGVIVRYLFHLVKYNRFRFKSIESLRGNYKGGTIIIIGSGPSLDTYPTNFIDDKLSMTLHLSYKKFNNPTFSHFTEGDRIPPLIREFPKFFESQAIICNPLFPLDHPAFRLKNAINVKYEPVFINYNPARLHFKEIESQIKAAISLKKFRYQTNATSLHTGIWSAIILGFSTIHLIGCDHGFSVNGSTGEEIHYSSFTDVKDTRQRTVKFLKDNYHRMKVFTEEIIAIAKNYDINIIQHKSYEEYDQYIKRHKVGN